MLEWRKSGCFMLMLAGGVLSAADPIDIGDRLQLFVDASLTERMDGVEYRLHAPVKQPLPSSPLPVPYTTVIKDGDRYRAWYRSVVPGYDGPRYDGHPGELTCYAESADGHEWRFPELGLHGQRSPEGGNVILANAGPSSHNFTPFIDARPGVSPKSRYKALGGTQPGGGLYAWQSADGIRWEKIRAAPVLFSWLFAFDSQNVAFWSVAENQYVCYFRTWLLPAGELRGISRATSPDFIHWSAPEPLRPNRPGEHLYTNQTQPYFRAPHIYLATPTRFMPDRGNSTDILFMTTRAGAGRYARLFAEAWIRPGLDPDRWGNRGNYLALGIVPTGPSEISLYHKSGHRYTLRTDGFVSIRAGAEPGEWISRPLVFSGSRLHLNFSTSAAGSLRVEIQDAQGRAVPGFALEDAWPLVGDAIDHPVQWLGSPDLSALTGRPVRLRFVLREADVFAFGTRD